MSNYYSSGKRQREANKSKKKQEKAQARLDRRERGPREIPIATAEDLHGNLPSIEDAMRALENPGQERSAATIPVRLFVGSLSSTTTASDLRDAFGAFGPVADAVVMTERETGYSRGFGFVTMANRKDAPRVIEALNGSDLKGASIVVNIATERR